MNQNTYKLKKKRKKKKLNARKSKLCPEIELYIQYQSRTYNLIKSEEKQRNVRSYTTMNERKIVVQVRANLC